MCVCVSVVIHVHIIWKRDMIFFHCIFQGSTPTSNASNKDSTNGTKSLPIDTITPASNASNKDSSNGTKSLGKQQLDPAVGTSNPLPKPVPNPSVIIF